MIMVSIIVPVYNLEKTIADSLISIIQQDYNNIEIIIVDDGSSDQSVIVAEEILSQSSFSYTIIKHVVNKGLSEARNTGIKNSTAKYLFFMDGDDTISRDCIRRLLEKAESSEYDFVDANFSVLGARTGSLSGYIDRDYYGRDTIVKNFFNNNIHVSACNRLIRRDFLLSNNLFFRKGLIHEDMLWTFYVCMSSTRFATISNKTYNYIIRNDSITRSLTGPKAKKNTDSIINIVLDIDSQMNKEDLSHDLKRMAKRWLTVLSFKYACRIVTIVPEHDVAKECYNRIARNDTISFLPPLSFLLKLPYPVFSFLFRIPYKYYTSRG